MAFSSYEELVSMSAKNPSKAMGFVKKAQAAQRPVVSRNNSGYGSEAPKSQAGAVQRRLRSMQTTAEKERDILSEERKNGYGS